MNKLQVKGIIDNTITQSLKNGDCLEKIISDIKLRRTNISKILKGEVDDFQSIFDGNYNEDEFSVLENKVSTRSKYALYYLTQSYKRINDLYWMIENQERFKLTNQNFFDLIKLRDRLKDNSYILPLA